MNVADTHTSAAQQKRKLPKTDRSSVRVNCLLLLISCIMDHNREEKSENRIECMPSTEFCGYVRFYRHSESSIQSNGMGTKSFAYFCVFRITFALNVWLAHEHRATIIHRSLLIIFKLFINGINYHGSHVIECSSVSDSNPCDLHTHSIAHLQRNVLRWWRRRWQRRRLNTHAKPCLRIFSCVAFASFFIQIFKYIFCNTYQFLFVKRVVVVSINFLCDPFVTNLLFNHRNKVARKKK